MVVFVRLSKRKRAMSNNTLTLTIRANTAALQAALKTAQASVKTFAASMGSKLANSAGDLKSAFDRAGGAIESTLKRVGLAAVGGSFGLAAFVKSASELQSLRASFQSLTGTVENTNSVMNTLYRYGKETAFDNQSIQASAKMFLANGVVVKDLMGWMRNLGDLAGATGANLQGLALPITQAIGTGKVMTQDWYQIINQGAGGLQKYIIAALGAGHSVKTFKDDLEKGRVTVDVMRKALQMASAEGGMAFQGALKQSQTFNGRMSNLQETITNVGLSILGVDAATGQVKAGGIFDQVSRAVENATKWLEENQDKILEVADTIKQNFVPAIASIGTAWAAMKIGSGVTAAIKRIDDFKKATDGAVSTFKLLNVAITGNPFGLIVAAITIVVSALVYLQMKFDIFGKAAEWIKNTWNDALSAVGGWIEGLKKTAGDVFSAIGTWVDNVKNTITGFGEAVRDWVVGRFEDAKKTAEEVFSAIGKWIDDNKTWLINLGIVIATIVTPKLVQLGIEAAKTFAGMARNAAVKGAEMAVSMAKSLATATASAAVNAGKMAAQGAVAFGSWIKKAAIASATATKNFTVMSAKAVVHAGKMGIQGTIAFGKWAAGAAVMGAKAVASFVMMGVQALVAGARIAASWLMAMGPIGAIVAVVAGVVALIIANWDTVKKWLTDFWEGVVAVAKGAWEGIVATFNAVVGFFSGLFQAAWNAIVAAWNGVVGFFGGLWNGIVGIFSAAIGFYAGIFSAAWDGVAAIWNGVVGFFGGVWGGIVGVFSVVGNWFSDVFQKAWNGIKNVFAGVGGFFRGIWDTIVGIFGKVGSSIGNAISGAVKTVVNSILGFAENTINGFIKAINLAIGAINLIPGVNIGKLNELNIPRLATGGIVGPQGGGSIIYAGDGGQNEWVVPESKMASLVRQINARGGAGVAGGVNITVNVTTRDEKFTDGDAVDIAQKINRALKAQGLRLDQMGALR